MVVTVEVEVAWPRPLVPVRLVRRVNRFAVEAVLDGNAAAGDDGAASGLLRLHLPNSGRMGELLVPGTPGRARLWPGQPGHSDGLGPADRPDAPDRPARRTHGELLLVHYAGRWVSVDARMPNRLFEACLAARALPAWARAVGWQREVRWGHGRIDFRVDMPAPEPPWLVEAKSCNLVEDGVALFPDAPTQRGARHLRDLAAAVAAGEHRAAVVWFVQRDDAQRLEPHRRADPEFARALAEAVAAGVEAHAYRCLVTEDEIRVLDAIPVVAG